MDDSNTREQVEMRRLFDAAAAKSLVVDCSLDAEPEMSKFVEFVRAHPDLRPDVIALVAESFSDDFQLKWPPVDLWRYCMHALRWPEVQEFILEKKREDAERHGARCSGAWDDILEVFEDGWEGAQYFKAFKKSPQ